MHCLRTALAAATIALVGPACGDAVADRVGADDGSATVAFGANDRVVLTTDAARVTAIDSSTTPTQVSVRAALPWPTLGLDNGVFADTTVLIHLSNIGAEARLRPTLRPLADGARQDPRCADVERVASVTLADLVRAPRGDDPNETTVRVQVPPCAGVTIDVTLPANRDVVELLFAGSAAGESRWVADAIAAAEQRDAALLYLIGGGATGGSAPYEDLRARADDASIPVSFGMGRGDRDDVAAWRQAFGPANAHVRVGDAHLFTFDATDGRLDSRQRAQIDDLGRRDHAAIVAMALPPFDPGGVDRFGWRSPVQAAAFVQLLASRGVDAVVASSHRADASRAFAGVEFVNLGGARREDRVWLRAIIEHPVADIPACDVAGACSNDDRCVAGWCRPPCANDADCTDGATCDLRQRVCRPTCGEACAADACDADGWCVDTPRITLVQESFDAPDPSAP